MYIMLTFSKTAHQAKHNFHMMPNFSTSSHHIGYLHAESSDFSEDLRLLDILGYQLDNDG